MKEVFYHGSPVSVEKLDMQTALMGGAKVKFGYGVCVTPVYEMAVKDSDVANEANMHYVYTVEVPAKTESNYLSYKEPVHPAIVAAVENHTGLKATEKIKSAGKDYFAFLAKKLTGESKVTPEGTKAATELLASVGVEFVEWPCKDKEPELGCSRVIFDCEKVEVKEVTRVFPRLNAFSVAQFIEQFYNEYWGIQKYPAGKCANFIGNDSKWGVFGNFFNAPLVVDGYSFRCSEELFQYMKFKDETVLRNLKNGISREGNNCPSIKKCAKSYEKAHRREDWGQMFIDAMKFCLQTKYEQCPKFRQELMWTQKLGLYIVEDQTSFSKPADAWGAKLKGNEFVGPNILGRLLMELRDNGKLDYKLPEDAFDFIKTLKSIS